MEFFHAGVVIPIKQTEDTNIIGKRRINGGRQLIGDDLSLDRPDP